MIKPRPKHRIIQVILFQASLIAPWANQVAMAGTYEALCGGNKCNIILTPEMIASPYGTIPPTRVTYWTSAGESSTSVGTGVATTLLFGGIGLLGFLAKNHNYTVSIFGFDANGTKTNIQIGFKNDKPVKAFIAEMAAFTGLGMGQTRTIADIKAAESGAAAGSESLGPQPSMGSLRASAVSGLSTAAPPPGRNCWSAYLKANPAMKKWVETNPSQAEQNKKRFDNC
jgi:hypothetical protein